MKDNSINLYLIFCLLVNEYYSFVFSVQDELLSIKDAKETKNLQKLFFFRGWRNNLSGGLICVTDIGADPSLQAFVLKQFTNFFV